MVECTDQMTVEDFGEGVLIPIREEQEEGRNAVCHSTLLYLGVLTLALNGTYASYSTYLHFYLYLLHYILRLLHSIQEANLYLQRPPQIHRSSSYTLSRPPDSDSQQIANIVVAKNLNAASSHVQIQALEVLPPF